jgi:hypothetical protein
MSDENVKDFSSDFGGARTEMYFSKEKFYKLKVLERSSHVKQK